MLTQRLQQKLLQKLSPQQIQLMKLIQIPTVALEQRIKQEIEDNPALEDVGDERDDITDEYSVNEDESIDQQDEFEEKYDDFDIEEYLDDDHIPPYKLVTNNRGRDDEDKNIPLASGISFHEHLYNQITMFQLDEREKKIINVIIGNINDSGYLERDIEAMANDLSFSFNIKVNKSELEKLLKVIHEFDPPGVGARNLQECLLIQLQRIEENSEDIELAKKIIIRFFPEFSRKHFDKILKRANVDEDQLKRAIDEILKLNPKPGNSIGESSRTTGLYIIPDFIITNNDGNLELTLNSKNTPELRINKSYKEMLEHFAKQKKNKASNKDKEALLFVKQKIDSAKWFMDAIQQRQNTLYITMRTIMEYQSDYFKTGDEALLKPMILKDIAEIVNLDISTISRVASSKYVQTPFGTFLLKTFFSEGLQTESGEEVSSREVKKILKDCISSEDKSRPLTDETLSKVLKDKGYTIARRTVAKYREQLGIPVARMRRTL